MGVPFSIRFVKVTLKGHHFCEKLKFYWYVCIAIGYINVKGVNFEGSAHSIFKFQCISKQLYIADIKFLTPIFFFWSSGNIFGDYTNQKNVIFVIYVFFCFSERLTPLVFSTQTKLLSVNLTNNLITDIQKGAFTNMTRMVRLILTRNKITRIGDHVLSGKIFWIFPPKIIWTPLSLSCACLWAYEVYVLMTSWHDLSMSTKMLIGRA